MDISTQLVQFDSSPGDPNKPSATPIYQTATFEQESATEFGPYDYSRSGNPTRDVLQDQIALIEGGCAGFAFSSGMAAIGCMAALVKTGEEILLGDDLYGGTFRFMERITKGLGIKVGHVDTTNLAAVAGALSSKTRLLILETPTNPAMEISDLRALAALTKANGTYLAVDGTVMSPYLQRPLELGADMVVHSATKALCGHGDVTAGSMAVANPALAEQIAFLINAQGTALGPFDCYLVLRGMKTLAIRLDRQQDSAMKVAAFLESHPAVRSVLYPGLKNHPGNQLHASQASGPGAIISVDMGSYEAAIAMVEQTELFRTTVSFGSVTSSISLPYCMSHASIPEDVRKTRKFSNSLIRLSIGIEDPVDLTNDLLQVLSGLESPKAVISV